MERLPAELCRMICDYGDSLDALRLSLINKDAHTALAEYAIKRQKERDVRFQSDNAQIITSCRGSKFQSRIIVGKITLVCRSNHGKSTVSICKRVKNIMVPMSRGAFVYHDSIG